MKSFFRQAIFTLALLCLPHASHAAGSLLRVTCEGTDVGAEIHINGKFRGECPVDVAVPEGTMKLRVVKNVDATHEQVFEQTVRLAEGNVKKIEVQLSAPRLTAAAQKVEDARLAEERAAIDIRERAEAAALSKELAAAAGGDTRAMITVAYRYRVGAGVARSEKEWLAWLAKAAAAGDSMGTFLASNLYRDSDNESKNRLVQEAIDLLELPRENLRQINLHGQAAVAAFFANDPFFAMPAAIKEEEIEHTNSVNSKLANGTPFTATATITCKRAGRYAVKSVKSKSTLTDTTTTTTTNNELLGGLAAESSRYSYGFFSKQPDILVDTTSLVSVHGQPFPLQPGKRFGFAYGSTADGNSGSESIIEVECGATSVNSLFCVQMIKTGINIYANTTHYRYDSSSGCLVATRN